MTIKVKDELNRRKEVKLGFSWTALFFGVFVPLLRGDWKWFLIIFAVEALLGAVTMGIATALMMIAFPFFYNKVYAQQLYKDGYRGVTEEENNHFERYVVS